MNILIIDDHELIVEGIKKRIKKIFPQANCLFADNIRSAYAMVRQNSIDLIISDLEFENHPEHDGFYMIKKLLSLEPRAKVIALTHYNSYRIMKKAKASGFMSFLNKGCSFEDFKDTLINVLKHGKYQSQTEKMLIHKRQKIAQSIFNESLKGICNLSNRELELAILIAQTTDRNELAKMMNIEPYTVDSHIKNIKSKLYLTNKSELAVFSMDFNDVLMNELKARKP